jgi:hypothetical protein
MTMKQNLIHYIRLAGTAALIAILAGLIVLGIGWLGRWHSALQFSNGFFTAGAIVIVLGLLSVMGGFSMRSDFRVLYSQSAGDMNLADRSRLWMADITQGYGVLILLAIAGFLLIGIAVLIGSLVG